MSKTRKPFAVLNSSSELKNRRQNKPVQINYNFNSDEKENIPVTYDSWSIDTSTQQYNVHEDIDTRKPQKNIPGFVVTSPSPLTIQKKSKGKDANELTPIYGIDHRYKDFSINDLPIGKHEEFSPEIDDLAVIRKKLAFGEEEKFSLLSKQRFESCLDTPKGKKSVVFDTPVRKTVIAAGIQGLSPATQKTTQKLGKGAFGQVIVGKYKEQKRAMKVIRKTRPNSITRETWSINFDHPNIIKTVDVCDSNNSSEYVIIVMEYVGSDTLQTYLNNLMVPMPLETCLKFTQHIANALGYCHKRKFLHMDVKPANIIVTPQGICKLTDFGSCISLEVDSEEKIRNFGQGTVPYAAPELFVGEYLTSKTDIYSLAIVMGQMWNGEDPYSKVDSGEVIIYKVVKDNTRPKVIRHPTSKHQEYYISLYEKGWSKTPNNRPTAIEISKTCSLIYNSLKCNRTLGDLRSIKRNSHLKRN